MSDIKTANIDLSILAGDDAVFLSIEDIKPLAEVERAYIERVINACHGSIPKAAGLLEVSPSTIYRKKQCWSD